MKEILPPDAVTAQGDPGDDTARRFSYQWTYAAIVGCALLDETHRMTELFCEHHEDILLKYQDGFFAGIQVKTRDSGSDPWRAMDELILSVLARFAVLEAKFPGLFREFVIATNHLFVRGKGSGSDLPFLLDMAVGTADARSIPPKLRPLAKRVAEAAACPASVALNALKKCRCDDSLPKLDDVKQKLVTTLTEVWPEADAISHEQLLRAAEALVAACSRASSLDHAQSLPGYLSAVHDGKVAADRAAVEAKRFDRARVETVLRDSINAEALLSGPVVAPFLAAVESTRLEKKLTAGGFSLVSINSAKDLRNKADYQALEWLNRLGEKKGLGRREHIRSLVLRDCAEAYEATKTLSVPFGIEMRTAFRERLRQRRKSGGATLFECLDEHLEGYAYVLTDECRVWWSEPFDLEEGRQ